MSGDLHGCVGKTDDEKVSERAQQDLRAASTVERGNGTNVPEPKNHIVIEGLTANSAHIGGQANYYDRRRNRKGKAEFPANMKPVDATSTNVKYTFKDTKFREDPIIGATHAYVDESTNDTNPGEDQSDQQ